MSKIAFVFPGQGAQYPGMGKSIYENSGAARELFDKCESLRPGTLATCFEGTEEELKQTSNTQPCLYLTGLGTAVALNEQGIFADAVAGFSLGELCALAYAGGYSPEDGFSAVCERGALMQTAAGENDTAMTAVLKASPDTVEKVCGEFNHVYPVNYNSPQQTVVSGLKSELDLFKQKMSGEGFRCVDLAVSAAFHSPYMADAAERFAAVLENIQMQYPKIPVYSNTTAQKYPENLRDALCTQIKSPVKWTDTINNMVNDGIEIFIETGTGKTLSGLIKRIAPSAKIYTVNEYSDIEKVISEVKANA